MSQGRKLLLGIEVNVDDDNYNLVNASGDRMTVLGTVVIYLHPEGSDTRPVFGIVIDDLGGAEILFSYSYLNLKVLGTRATLTVI